MSNIKDITQLIKKTAAKENSEENKQNLKMTSPIFKKLVSFANEKLSKKFDVNDLFK